jgi:crossover junction endodeoxyribonuclease RusA
MATFRITTSLPPSVNHMYRRHTLTGNRKSDGKAFSRVAEVYTREAEAWIGEAQLIAKTIGRRAGWGEPRPNDDYHKVIVALWAYWPDAIKRDMSNLHKIVADALEGIVYVNDRTSLLRDMDYEIDRQRPRLVIEVSDFGED